MKKRILFILIALFSLSLASDLLVNLFDYQNHFSSVSMDCDENDLEDNEEQDKETQDFIIKQLNFNLCNVVNKPFGNRYIFSISALKASPELPPPDRD